MIKAVIFDFGRVISAPKPPSLFRKYEDDLGLAAGTINSIMFGSQAWQEVLVGHITSDEYWRRVGPVLGLHTAEAIAAFRRRYGQDEAINQPVLDIIQRLHGQYKLAVLSNSPPGLSQWLADWGLLDWFEVVVCSGDEGVVKPDPTIFHLVLTRLGVAPAEAVFVDDTLGHVQAARGLGLHGLHYATAKSFEAKLDQLLVAEGGLGGGAS